MESDSAADAHLVTPAPPAPADGRLWNRDFFLLWQGQTVSQLGNQAFSVAMAVWLVKATGSASLMGLLLTASSLPGVVLGPLGGAIADRFSRRIILIVSDVIGGVAMTTLALVMLSGRAATPAIVTLLFVVAVVMGTVRAFFAPAIGAAIPDLVPSDKLNAANSVNQLSVQGSLLVGQGLGGVLYQLLGGAPLLFLLDGLSYFFAAGSEAFVRLPARAVAADEGRGIAAAFRRYARDIGEGFSYVRSTRGLLGFVLASSGYNFFIMPILVLLPFYVTVVLRADARWYGFLLAAISAGSIVGFLVAGFIPLRGAAKARFLTWLMILAPTPFILLGGLRSSPLALIVGFVLGAAIGIVNVNVMTILQAGTPAEMRGRVMGLVGTLGGAVVPLGMALGGIAGDLTGKNVPLIYAVCGALSCLFTFIFLHRGGTQEFLARD